MKIKFTLILCLVCFGLANRAFAQTFSDANWISMGGLEGYVASAVVDGFGNLYVGGTFTNAGGNWANHVAKWNGSSWSRVGLGLNNYVFELAVSGTVLYAATGGPEATAIRFSDGMGAVGTS